MANLTYNGDLPRVTMSSDHCGAFISSKYPIGLLKKWKDFKYTSGQNAL